MNEVSTTGQGRRTDVVEVARRTVTSSSNLVRFGERGFRTVIINRVLDQLVLTAGFTEGEALAAARQAIEEVGGFVVGRRSEFESPTRGRYSRPVSEVWMIPETVVLPAVAPTPQHRPRAA